MLKLDDCKIELFMLCSISRLSPKSLKDFMDWNLALEHNQAILLRNVAWLFTWLKLEVGESVETLSRLRRSTILFVLRPTESACRRLVYTAMIVRGIVMSVRERALKMKRGERQPPEPRATSRSALPFKLLDPRKSFDLLPDRPKYVSGPGPWVTDLWSDDPIFDRSALYAHQEKMNRPPPSPDDEMSAGALCRRMNSLMVALGDLDAQVLRMAKLQARMKQALSKTGKLPKRVLRPGLPPGHRQRQKHEVDEVLVECHRLALMAQHELKPPDP